MAGIPNDVLARLTADSDRLTAADQVLVRELVDALDAPTVAALRDFCVSGKKKAVVPARETIRRANTVAADHRAAEARGAGERALAAGKVAVLMVAGGKGSRMGFE